MDSLTTFSRKAEDYAAYRAEYASEAISALIAITGLESSWIIADIGSGTGSVSKHLVHVVTQILAVEPNEDMRYQAERCLNGYASFKSIDGKAEQTTLPNKCVDLITIGQAHHWFNPHASKIEFSRILKPEGWLAIIWNDFGKSLDLDFGFYFTPDDFKHMVFPLTLHERWEQYIGSQRSASDAPCEGEPAYEAFERKHRGFFDSRAVDGLIEVRYKTKLALGRLNRRI
jgi:ubiquinone/menaquinone biosynthesis C-methylase UbiE